jgi:hypothetical protein
MLSLALKRGVASKALAKVKASYKLGEVRRLLCLFVVPPKRSGEGAVAAPPPLLHFFLFAADRFPTRPIITNTHTHAQQQHTTTTTPTSAEGGRQEGRQEEAGGQEEDQDGARALVFLCVCVCLGEQGGFFLGGGWACALAPLCTHVCALPIAQRNAQTHNTHTQNKTGQEEGRQEDVGQEDGALCFCCCCCCCCCCDCVWVGAHARHTIDSGRIIIISSKNYPSAII